MASTETAQGVRYTLSEQAWQEVLARLLRLNFARYAQECRAGLHKPKERAAFELAHPELMRPSHPTRPPMKGNKQVPDYDDYVEQSSLFDDDTTSQASLLGGRMGNLCPPKKLV
ncbi:MAG UNVERIFIED_CONTAM: hypothetical protein LVT10_00860 [Anaerolineae bacterium]|jgi:hypothetical protein